MPPDRPIRSRQYAFPDISEPAFHYKNPVSGREPERLLPWTEITPKETD